MPSIVVGRDENDLKKYGEEGTFFIGKHLVGTGEEAHTTTPVLLDALRPHVICITGKRGEGKCLHGDSLITMSDGSVLPIKEIEKNENTVLALDDELKIKFSRRENFYKRTVNEMLYLKLRSGREIRLTPEHPLLTINGWRSVMDLKIGSRIATPRKMSVFGDKKIRDCEIKILAYLIAEGHIKSHNNHTYINFTNFDDSLIDDFSVSVKEFNQELQLKCAKKGTFKVKFRGNVKSFEIIKNEKGQICKGSRVEFIKNPLVVWLDSLGLYGKLSKEKFIPGEIFRLEKESLRLFLNRLFSCDGSIYKRDEKYEVSYCSSSEKMIHQIQHLLLRFGVVSKLREKKIRFNGKNLRSFELSIIGGFSDIFLEEIGFYGEKEKKQRLALNECVKRNPNTDTIPRELWDSYRPKNWAAVDRAIGYAYPKAMRESIKYSPSREKLLQIAKIENNEGLRLLSKSDVFWDEIVEIRLESGEFEVYDISVPEHHNFVANDIIVHNSFSMGVIVEEMMKVPEHIRRNLCSLIVDTQGIFWTMKYSNEKELTLLNSWNLKPAGFDVFVCVPEGQEDLFSKAGVEYDDTFSIMPSQLSADDWLVTLGLKSTEPLGILLQQSLNSLRGEYDIEDIIESSRKQEGFEQEKIALKNYLQAAKRWGIFGKSRMPEILKPGKVTVLDVSMTPDNVRSLLVSLVSSNIFSERVKARRKEELADVEGVAIQRVPMCWIMIDEAHNFLPADTNTAATPSLNRIVKEGRQPGITLVLATQRPEKLHPDALAQCDLILSHRLTAKNDIEALKSIMQTYMLFDISTYINELPKLKGTAIILDDNSERIYKVRMRPRQSWHAGSSPVAV